MQNTHNRTVWVDELRGYSCLLIILLHVAATTTVRYGAVSNYSWEVSNVINTFTRMAVPIFFAISGYVFFFDRFPKSKHFIKVIANLILYSLIALLYLHFIYGQSFNKLNWNIISKPAFGHLWFFYYILQIYLISVIIHFRTVKNSYFILILILIFTVFNPQINNILALFGYKFQFYGFFSEATIFYAMYAFLGAAIGHMEITDYYKRKNRAVIISLLAFTLAWLVSVLATRLVTHEAGKLIETFYENFTVSNFIMTIATLVIFKETQRWSGIRWFLCHIARYSVSIYGIHVFFIYLPWLDHIRNHNFVFLDIGLTFLFVLFLSYLFARIIVLIDTKKLLI